MTDTLDLPLLVFVLSMVVLWFFAQVGVFIRTKLRPLEEDERQDFVVVLTANDAPRPSYWVQLLDGHQPVQPAQGLRG